MVDVYRSAKAHLAALAAGEYSALELLDAHLAQIEAVDGTVNAVVWQDADQARQQAAAVQGPATPEQPLLGLSMTVKEAYNITGSPTTWGEPYYRDNIDQSDALAIERLRAAGAIIFGKTNVPYGLADLQSYNDIYGQSNNPYHPEHTPGGSSGGSGAALAAGYTALEMGSDIGGSIRTPAHFCGVFGHKPTWALIPSRGHALPGAVVEPDIAVIGPMARSAHDLEMMLDILALPDHFQPGVRYQLDGLGPRQLSDLKVAVWASDDVAPVDASVAARVQQVAQSLREAGAQVDDTARPNFNPADSHAVYQQLLAAAMAGGIPRGEFATMQQQAAAADPSDAAADNLRRSTMSHREWIVLHNHRDQLRWAWHEFFQSYDLVLAPQTATHAMRHDHSPLEQRTIEVNGVDQPYWQQIFWAGLVGVARLPSTVIPTGLDDSGLPIGVQLIGNAYSDRLTIQVAQALEGMGYTFTPPPHLGD